MITIDSFNPFNGTGFNPFDIMKNSGGIPWMDQFRNNEWLEKYLKDMFGQNSWSGLNSQTSIKSGVFETSDEVVVKAEIPGIEKREDLKISISGMDLLLEAIQLGGRSDFDFVVQEAPSDQPPRKIRQKIKLPVPVKTFGARASYRKGILEIKLPKEYVSQKVEQIQVQFL